MATTTSRSPSPPVSKGSTSNSVLENYEGDYEVLLHSVAEDARLRAEEEADERLHAQDEQMAKMKRERGHHDNSEKYIVKAAEQEVRGCRERMEQARVARN